MGFVPESGELGRTPHVSERQLPFMSYSLAGVHEPDGPMRSRGDTTVPAAAAARRMPRMGFCDMDAESGSDLSDKDRKVESCPRSDCCQETTRRLANESKSHHPPAILVLTELPQCSSGDLGCSQT